MLVLAASLSEAKLGPTDREVHTAIDRPTCTDGSDGVGSCPGSSSHSTYIATTRCTSAWWHLKEKRRSGTRAAGQEGKGRGVRVSRVAIASERTQAPCAHARPRTN
jgi:hypothetical protein